MSGPEERQRAVDLYSATPMTTAQVVEHLGYPTRQCLECWPAADSRYAGHMAKPIIPLETRTKAIEPVPDGMQQKRAAERLGARRRNGPQPGQGVSRGRHGRVAARKQERRPSQQASDVTGSIRRRRRGPAPQDRGAGTGERGDAGGGGGVRRLQGQVRVPQDHGRGWSDGACSRTTRVRLIRGRGHAGSRRPRRPRFHGWDAEREMARGHHPESGPGTGRRASRRRSTATTAGSSHARPVPIPTPGSPTECSSGPWRRCRRGQAPGAFRPRMPPPAARMAGAHGPLRPGTVDGRQGPFPGRRCRGGAPRTHEDGNPSIPGIGGSVPATRCSSRSTTASAGTTTGASNGRSIG